MKEKLTASSSLLLLITMDVKKEAGTTEFFDRPFKIFRVKRNGVLERLGGREGGMKVRLMRDPASSLTPYVLLHHCGALICKAEIAEKIQEVSEDGYTIHLNLHEESVHNFKRRYIFVFHDEDASMKFFQIYEQLRGRKDGDRTFWDLQEAGSGAGSDLNFYFVSGEEEGLMFEDKQFAHNFSNLKIDKKKDLDCPCDQNDGTEKADENGHSNNELDIKEEDAKDEESPFDLPSLDDFSQDVYALNMEEVHPKWW